LFVYEQKGTLEHFDKFVKMRHVLINEFLIKGQALISEILPTVQRLEEQAESCHRTKGMHQEDGHPEVLKPAFCTLECIPRSIL